MCDHSEVGREENGRGDGHLLDGESAREVGVVTTVLGGLVDVLLALDGSHGGLGEDVKTDEPLGGTGADVSEDKQSEGSLRKMR